MSTGLRRFPEQSCYVRSQLDLEIVTFPLQVGLGFLVCPAVKAPNATRIGRFESALFSDRPANRQGSDHGWSWVLKQVSDMTR